METSEKVLRTSTPRANRQHVCSVCGKPIEKGERYLNITIKQGKKLVSRKTHFGCSEKKEQPKVMAVPGVPVTEAQFKQQVHDDTLTMLETFTFEENMKIAFLPLIITEVAWHYAFKVVKQAADYRIEATKKLSRTVKMLREKYISDCKKDLDRAHIEKMEKGASMFIKGCGNDFLLLFFSMNNLLKKQWADVPYLDMRTDACITMVLLKMLKEHSKKMDELMASKLGGDVPAYRNPINEALWDCMDAYADPCQFSFDGHVRTSMQIIMKKFNQIEWDIK